MELLAKWNLSNAYGRFSKKIYRDDLNLPTSVKQGRQLLNQIVIPHISFKKSPIMTYKEEPYYLHYCPIFDTIKELLSNKEIFDNCFKYTPLYHEGQRIYYEQYNGDWWKRVQNSLPRDAKVLSIILYSDTITCDHLGKTSKHSIYLTLGNIIS